MKPLSYFLRRTALICGAFLAPLGAAEQPAVKQPVYVHLFHTQHDFYNTDWTWERLDRTFETARRLRERYPDSQAVVMVELNGAIAETFVQFNRVNRAVDRFYDGVSAGFIEIGYDGAYEPSPRERPRPDFRHARTADDRWLARVAALEAFLDDFKSMTAPYGEPDASRPGGLKRTRDVYGEMALVRGIDPRVVELPELAHVLRTRARRAVLAGIPEASTWPLKNLDGVNDAAAQFGKNFSPDSRCAPQVYWQNGHLHLSDNTGAPVRVFSATDGPEPLKKAIESLDRSRPNVLRLEISPPSTYLKKSPEGIAPPVPILRVFDYWKRGKVPDEFRKAPDEVAESYRRQEAALEWLAAEFFPANQGSRFLSATAMQVAAERSLTDLLSLDQLRHAARKYVEDSQKFGPNPPAFAAADGYFLSMADLFKMLANMLGAYHRAGSFPPNVPFTGVYGPRGVGGTGGLNTGHCSVKGIISAAADVARNLNDMAWKPLPASFIPETVIVEDHEVNAAQFLHLMAKAFLEPDRTEPVGIEMQYMLGAEAVPCPRFGPASEQGYLWTLKPAPLRFE